MASVSGIEQLGLCNTAQAHIGKRSCAAQNRDLSPNATRSGGWGKITQGTKQLSSSPNPSHGCSTVPGLCPKWPGM
eukprot:3134502-Amphidinium_carterae.1